MKYSITILFFLSSFIANSQNTFVINYERSNNPSNCDEGAECIDIFPNGDYIIGGGYYSCIGPVLFRVNSQGVVLWDTILSVPFFQGRFIYVEVTNDDGFLALDDGGYLYKFNNANSLLWTLNTQCKSQAGNAKLIETNDGYVLTGYTSMSTCIVKINLNASPIFSNVFTNAPGSSSFGLGLKQTSDGGYIISGSCTPVSSSEKLVYLIKTDSAGTFQWAKTYDSPSTYGYGIDILLADNGGYFICDFNYSDVCIIKADSLGAMQWAKSYDIEFGNSDPAFYLLKTNDDKIIVAGMAGNNYCLMKLDTNGNWLWTQKYPPTGGTFSAPTVVRQTNDGGFALVQKIPGINNSIHCFIKTDSSGDVAGVCSDSSLAAPLIQNIANSYTVTSVPNNGTNTFTVSPIIQNLGDDPVIRTVYCNVTPLSSETIAPDNNVVSVFPNPTTGIFTIQSSDPSTVLRVTNIEIINVLSEKVYSLSPGVYPANNGSEGAGGGFSIDLSKAPSGIYFYKVFTPSPEGEGRSEVIISTGKLIIE